MPYRNLKPTYGNFILIFVGIKILFNLLAISHFGFHRDELLHLALGDHLAWGYKEVPPFIAFLAAIVNHVFGSSLVAARIFPTLFAAMMVWFTGKLVVEFGGRRLAITIACLTLIFSPAFAASDYLFQPVIFDQFWWLVTVCLLVKYLNTRNVNYMYLLGAAVGLGILNKYTMIFFVMALVIGLLISKQRKVIWSKPFLISALIAFAIALPNFIWQATHHMPVFTHMSTLQKYQLDKNDPIDFIKQQFLVHGVGLFVWVIGLLSLFGSYKLRKYMFVGIAYLLVFAFLLKMNGKAYYLFPAYPMLFAAGAYMIERWVKTSWRILRGAIIVFLTLPNLILFPLVLPFLTLNETLAYTKWAMQKMPDVHFIVTWEDKKEHPLTQDYADMLGWEEMVAKTAKIYFSLTPEERAHTIIFADNYGEAGAFQHFGPKYHLPAIVCLNSSFALWAPKTIAPQNLIYVSDDKDVSDLKPVSTSIELKDEITDPLAREHGTGIFLLKGMKPAITKIYEENLKQKLSE
jgi:4-amino-4-deoxy-L-arabinose transferase-like glycosyltransferase